MKCPYCNTQIHRCPECGATLKKRRTRNLQGGSQVTYYTCNGCGIEWREKKGRYFHG